jgi:hypothetical protein
MWNGEGEEHSQEWLRHKGTEFRCLAWAGRKVESGERTTSGVVGGKRIYKASWKLSNEEARMPRRTGESRA